MGSGNEASSGRRLRLERETLRDLEPTSADAAAVRGGDDDSRTGRTEFCMPAMPETMRVLLGSTMISYGCKGVIRFERTETGHEIHVDLDANDAVLAMEKRLEQQKHG